MRSKASGKYIRTTVGGEAVDAFVPNPLPPKLTARELDALEEPLRNADAAIDRLRLASEMIPSLDWFIYSFVRKEALLSSEIEGTQATLTDVLSYEQTGQAGSSTIANVEEVTNYVAAINFAFEELSSKRGLPVSARLLDQCHLRLMQGVRGENKQPGDIRRSQVWIGATRPGNAVFVPPPAENVRDLLSDLETYIHQDDDLSPILRTAAAHAQFETIHPYLDGNGRVGRMLISLLLAHWGLVSSPLLYLSVFLKAHQSTYYERLNKVRTDGDWLGWFSFFLEGVEQVADDASKTASSLYNQVSRDRNTLLATDSVTVSAIQLFEILPKTPVVSMPVVTKLLDTTKPTASKAIELLQQVGILAEVGERKRDRLYAYRSYVTLLK
ncbi:MAG: Fic family protein [Planctomycetota bacterium]